MRLGIFLLLLAFCSCKEANKKSTAQLPEVKTIEREVDSVLLEIPEANQLKSLEGIADTTFVRLADYSHDFVYDLRYATTNNFLKEKVYDLSLIHI